jgi:hypothetical protein
VNGNSTKWTEKESLNGQMGNFTEDNIRTIRKMDMDSSNGRI